MVALMIVALLTPQPCEFPPFVLASEPPLPMPGMRAGALVFDDPAICRVLPALIPWRLEQATMRLGEITAAPVTHAVEVGPGLRVPGQAIGCGWTKDNQVGVLFRGGYFRSIRWTYDDETPEHVVLTPVLLQSGRTVEALVGEQCWPRYREALLARYIPRGPWRDVGERSLSAAIDRPDACKSNFGGVLHGLLARDHFMGWSGPTQWARLGQCLAWGHPEPLVQEDNEGPRLAWMMRCPGRYVALLAIKPNALPQLVGANVPDGPVWVHQTTEPCTLDDHPTGP